MTPRELEAHQRLADTNRIAVRDNMAALLAALHNGPLIRKDEQQWTPAMFLPDYVQRLPIFDWKRDLENTMAAMPKKKDAKRDEIERAISVRLKRAAQAGKDGATAEQVNAIMRGVL